MNKPIKTKLCWNCEGNVSRTIENCPYCGVYLSPETTAKEDKASPSLLKPPYTPEAIQKEQEIPKAPYAPQEKAELKPLSESLVSPVKEVSAPIAVLLTLVCLTAGMLALIFALMLLLFSSHGTLVLQWQEENWYWYALVALPLLVFGWIRLEQLSDEA